jgi:hypothetical protein
MTYPWRELENWDADTMIAGFMSPASVGIILPITDKWHIFWIVIGASMLSQAAVVPFPLTQSRAGKRPIKAN